MIISYSNMTVDDKTLFPSCPYPSPPCHGPNNPCCYSLTPLVLPLFPNPHVEITPNCLLLVFVHKKLFVSSFPGQSLWSHLLLACTLPSSRTPILIPHNPVSFQSLFIEVNKTAFVSTRYLLSSALSRGS